MADDDLTMGLVVRLADADDIPAIEALDGLSTSPFREIHQDLQSLLAHLTPVCTSAI